MISVLILTKNEEVNVATCLDSVAWSDDVVVFDSNSTDRTVEIARSKGAQVIQHAFENYGAQREAARTMPNYRHPWVLALDADERPEPDLVDELRLIASDPGVAYNAFRMRRKDHFLGKWIKHSTLYPSWFVRFYRHERIRYEPRAVHEYPTVEGATGELAGHLLHYSFSKGIGEWIEKHNRYSAFEAQELLKDLDSGRLDWGGLLALGDPVRRRRALKQLSFRLPFRPSLRFWYMYALRLGVLDGTAGLAYCRLLAMYEYMIDLKVRELRRQREGKPV